MPITNQNAVIQGLANIRLESLVVPPEILALFDKALKDGQPVDTSTVLDSLRG